MIHNGTLKHTQLGQQSLDHKRSQQHALQHADECFILPALLCEPHHRNMLAEALKHRDATIPVPFKPCYLDFQNTYQRHYLKQVNLSAQLFFLWYFFADWILLDDITVISGISRVIVVLCFLLINWWMFKYCKNIFTLDVLLPTSSATGAAIWFWLLSQSSSPNVPFYQYAAVIFVLFGSLSAHVSFRSSVLTTILISTVVMAGILCLNDVEHSLIFLLVFIPIVFFSLYVSWNNTLNARRTFLRSMLEEWDRHMLRELAHTDELTQLNNRRQFEFIADKRIHAWPPYKSTCLLMFDVDYFKKINDSYGHDIGDVVLQQIAEMARKEMRRADVLARFGGEEFVALLPETALEDAIMIANRLRKNIEAHPLYLNPNTPINFTISVGVSRVNQDNIDLQLLIKQADIAMYQAKQNGRNQVISFESLPA